MDKLYVKAMELHLKDLHKQLNDHRQFIDEIQKDIELRRQLIIVLANSINEVSWNLDEYKKQHGSQG